MIVSFIFFYNNNHHHHLHVKELITSVEGKSIYKKMKRLGTTYKYCDIK